MARSPPKALVPPRLHCSLRASKSHSNNNVPVMTTLRSLWEGLRRPDAIGRSWSSCCPGTGGCSESVSSQAVTWQGPGPGGLAWRLAFSRRPPQWDRSRSPQVLPVPVLRPSAWLVFVVVALIPCHALLLGVLICDGSRPTSRTCAPGPGACRHGDHKCTPGLSGVSDPAGTREGKRPGDGRAEAAAPTRPQPGPARVSRGEDPISHRPARWFQPEVTSGGSAGDRARLAWSAGFAWSRAREGRAPGSPVSEGSLWRGDGECLAGRRHGGPGVATVPTVWRGRDITGSHTTQVAG